MSPYRRFISCFLLLLGLCGISGSEVTCRAPSVRRGDPGEIICDFGDDLSQATEGGVSVRKYSLDGTSTDIILLCKWINGQPACHPNKDYIFNNTISSTLVLQIPAAVGRYEGRYTCQKVPSDGSETKLCEFSLQEAETTVTQSRGDKVVTRKEASGEQNLHGSDQDGTKGESFAAVAGGTVSGVVAVIVVVVIVVIIVKRKNVKLYKDRTYYGVEDFPMPPPIGDCRETNKGEKPEIQMDSGYSSPLDQISGSSSDSSMKKPCPAKWRVVDSGDYSLIEESDAGIGHSPFRVLTKDKHGYSDVEVLGPSPPIDSASATPFEVVNVTPTGASPLGAVPGRKDGFNRQVTPYVHQVRGPHGNLYTQVNKVRKGVSGLPTTGGNAAKVEGKKTRRGV